jgi:hypothetical protein
MDIDLDGQVTSVVLIKQTFFWGLTSLQ